MDPRILMMGKSPKELRALARELNAMAQTLEMAENPQKFMEKKVKRQVSGMRTKVRNKAVKNLGL